MYAVGWRSMTRNAIIKASIMLCCRVPFWVPKNSSFNYDLLWKQSNISSPDFLFHWVNDWKKVAQILVIIKLWKWNMNFPTGTVLASK